MEKLPMCRICLVENVRMYVVVNRNLRKLYEKLTDIPFVTEDIRPILACFFCCTKLKQCYQLLTQCLEAEELFAQRMTEDCEPTPIIIQDHYSLSPIVHISIVDGCQTGSIDVKEELPAVCEGLDDVIEPKDEYESDDLEQEHFDEICLDVPDTPPRHSESDLEDDEPLIDLKTEEDEVLKKKGRAREMIRATVAKEPKLDTLKTKLEDAITDAPEQTKKEKSNTQDIRITRIGTSNRDSYFIEPYKYDQRNFDQIKKKIHHTLTQTGDKHKCGVCQRSFSDKGNLTKHIRKHTDKKPYKCHVCQKSFSVKSNLNQHIRLHTGEKPYKCDICHCSYSQKSNLTKHIRIHTGEKLYKCNICHRSYSQKSHLKNHTRIHSCEKPYKCDVCQQRYSTMSNLNRHIRIHTGEKPYRCDLCQRTFRDKEHLIKHIRVHTGEKPYKCYICHRSYSQKSHLTNHTRIHTGEKPYKCDVCPQSFTTKSSLNQHILIHPGEKPYTCDVCQRSFRGKEQYIRHIRIHTGEKPYKCDVCQKSFTTKSSLNQHIRIHTGEKPYKCDICHRSYSQKSNLTKHIRIHTGEKPYKSTARLAQWLSD